MVGDMDSVRIGLQVRALRRRARLTQAELGSRARLSASAISRVERGRADRVSPRALERLVTALGARLLVSIQWQGEALDRLLDSEHAKLVDWAIGWLRSQAWEASPEVTFQVGYERGSIDILARHPSGALLVVEVKSTIPDAQATLMALDRKVRLARVVAADRGWRPVTAVSRLLIVPDDRTARRRVAALEATFAAAVPARSWAVKRWVGTPEAGIAGLLFVPNVTDTATRHRIGGGHSRRPGGPCSNSR